MTEKSASDVLRELLDERGVKWWPSDDRQNESSITHWKVGHVIWTAFDAEADGRLWLNASSDEEPLTPEQAIAVTLGGRKLTADDVLNAVYKHGARWQAIADELNAVIGGGECELHECEGSFSALNRPVWRCDCGAFMTQYTDATTYHKPRFCPNCGRKAVKR